MRAYAEWLWIDSKFSASTTNDSMRRGSAFSRAGHIAHQVFDELGIVVGPLGDVLLVDALEQSVDFARGFFFGDADQVFGLETGERLSTAIVTCERWLCAP
jgi:hypothetical protein